MVTTAESNRPQVAVPPVYSRSTAPVESPLAAEEFKTEGEARTFVRRPVLGISLVVAGATMTSMWALGAVVLGIAGLSGFQAAAAASTATILLGLGFLTLGDAGWLSHSFFHSRSTDNRWSASSLWTAALLAGFAGLSGVILGILGFLFPTAVGLLGVAAVVFGIALLGTIGLTQPTSYSEHAVGEGHRRFFLMQDLVLGLELFIGVGTIILGILALLGHAPLMLGLLSMLAIGAATIFVATAVCGTTMHALAHLCQAHRQQ
jgi:hypothetical protein